MSEIDRKWLESELARQLGPVAAPQGLWDRIQRPRRPTPAHVWALWPAITLTLLAACCILVWQISHARSAVTDLSQLSDRELESLIADSAACDLRSNDPAEIRNWVKARCNIDIALPDGRPAAIHLLGARTIRTQGLTIAAVAYQVAGEPATLLVSRKSSGVSGENRQTTKHRFARTEPALWAMGQQEYAIAWNPDSKDSQAACQLCHSAPAL